MRWAGSFLRISCPTTTNSQRTEALSCPPTPQKATRYHTLLCFINVLVIYSNGTVGFVGFLQGNDQQSILLNRVAASQSRAFAFTPDYGRGRAGLSESTREKGGGEEA